MQYKKNASDLTKLTSKEGEQRLLYCNKVSSSPSLDFNPNTAFVTEDIAMDYLAEILVQIYLNDKRNQLSKKGSDLLSGIDKRTG
jgi:hypothetical protein